MSILNILYILSVSVCYNLDLWCTQIYLLQYNDYGTTIDIIIIILRSIIFIRQILLLFLLLSGISSFCCGGGGGVHCTDYQTIDLVLCIPGILQCDVALYIINQLMLQFCTVESIFCTRPAGLSRHTFKESVKLIFYISVGREPPDMNVVRW